MGDVGRTGGWATASEDPAHEVPSGFQRLVEGGFAFGAGQKAGCLRPEALADSVFGQANGVVCFAKQGFPVGARPAGQGTEPGACARTPAASNPMVHLLVSFCGCAPRSRRQA